MPSYHLPIILLSVSSTDFTISLPPNKLAITFSCKASVKYIPAPSVAKTIGIPLSTYQRYGISFNESTLDKVKLEVALISITTPSLCNKCLYC